MFINGLNSKRSMRVLSFSLMFGFLFLTGCQNISWTKIYYSNFSDDTVNLSINGMKPNCSPGKLLPGDGTELLKEVRFNIGDPVYFDEVIKFEWKVNSEETQHEKEFKRDDLGIPSVVHGGKIRITYTKTGDWEIDYSRWN